MSKLTYAKIPLCFIIFSGMCSSGIAGGWQKQFLFSSSGGISGQDTRNYEALPVSDGQVPHGSFGNYTARIVGLGPNKSLTVYSGRSTASREIGSIPSDAVNITVKVCARHAAKTWCSIRYKGLRGYVRNRNLQRTN